MHCTLRICIFSTVFDIILGVEVISKSQTYEDDFYLIRILTAFTTG